MADLLGQRFGRLVVEVDAGRTENRKRRWICRCDCGGTTATTTGDLRAGTTASCGCLQRERTGDANRVHGGSASSAYASWKSMWARCSDPRTSGWEYYGGRGITVCDRWRDFTAFLEDMGARPDGCSLDRIDSGGDYNQANCRWATRIEQASNRRNSRYVLLDGERLTVAEAARRIGVDRATLGRRAREKDLAELGLLEEQAA